MKFNVLIAILFAISPVTAKAESHLNPADQEVLACLDSIGNGAEWSTCVGMLFRPCGDVKAGSEEHVTCLTGQREHWRQAFTVEQNATTGMLTDQGAKDLTGILGQWVGYVSQKCQEASLARGGSQAALLGCEVAETANATAEIRGCRIGISTAPYCVMKDG